MAIFLIVLAANALLAQIPTDSTRKKKAISAELLNEVLITARRSEALAQRTAASVNVLNSKYLQTYQPRTTPEALMGVAGVFVQKTNHGGGSPFVRGLTGNQTLTLIDGIRLNNSTFRYGPNQYLNTVDAFSLDRIEVLRGGGSVQYGTDALGGTIHLFTREPELGGSSEVQALGQVASSGMERSFHGELTSAHTRWAATVGYTNRHFGDLIGGDTTGRQTPSGYSEQAFNTKLKVQIGKNAVLTLAHQGMAQRHVPVFHKVRLENFALNEFDPQRRTLRYARLETGLANRFLQKITTTFSHQSTHEGRVSQKNNSSTRRTETDRVRTAGLTVNVFSAFSENWTANSGVELYRDAVKSDKIDVNSTRSFLPQPTRGLYPDGATYLNYAVYSLHEYQLARWQFSLGGRFNGFSINLTDATLGNVNLQPKALVGNAAVLYEVSERSNVYASFNSGFRAPNIDDLGTLGIVDFRYEVPTAGLKPERSANIELGYKLRSRRVGGSLAVFQNELQNLITRVKVGNEQIQGYPVYRKENVERATVRGAELELETAIVRPLKIYGSLAYAYGQNVTKGEPLRRVPPLNGRLGLELRCKTWFVRPETAFASKQDRLATGDRDDNRIPKGGTPGWVIFNVLAGYEGNFLNVNLSLQNLTNVDYRTHGSGINGVGRSAWLTVGVVF